MRFRARMTATLLALSAFANVACTSGPLANSQGGTHAPSPAPQFVTETLSATRYRIRIVQPVRGSAADNLMLAAARRTSSAGKEWFEILKRDDRTIEFAVGSGEGDALAGGAKRHDARQLARDLAAKLDPGS